MASSYIHVWQSNETPLHLIGGIPRRVIRTRLTAVAPGIIRVTRTGRDSFLDRTGPAALPLAPESDFRVTENEKEIRLSAGGTEARICRKSGALSFYDAQGRLLLKEPDIRPHQLAEKPVMINRFDGNEELKDRHSVDGVRAEAVPVHAEQDRVAYEYRQSFVFDPEEGLYGLGSHEEGFGNLRGHRRQLYQHNMKAVVPMLVSTKGWGILFDMGCYMVFHDDEEGSYLWADCADEPDWYFCYGDGSYASLMGQYRLLTGETPMLPLYALGYIQSKERYKDANELLAVTDEYRRRQVPLDMVVLDWMSWPQDQWGYKTFDPERFPDPDGMMKALHERNTKLMISIWPSMQGERNDDRQEMLENDLMLGNRTIYNAFLPRAREVYWRQAYEGLFRHGVDAWWCDCSEPFEADWHGEIRPEPEERARINTEEGKKYLDPGSLNLYSLYHSEGIWQGQRKTVPLKRVMNLTRSSFAGQHRYATVTWSGDVSSTWETLRRHIPEGLNFMATGEAFWSTDIGGFFPQGGRGPWFAAGEYEAGAADLGYRELFVRWMQYGMCLPCMRAHGTATPREIWSFGEKGEPFYDAIEKSIRLRYRLIPYLYSLMARLNREGVPMVQVPALVFPEDPAMQDLTESMMIGDSLLARPVCRPMLYNAGSVPIADPDETVPVTLPAGNTWYVFGEDTPLSGGQTLSFRAPLDTLPLFARGGSILPLGEEAQYTGQIDGMPITLLIYPGRDAEFILYHDSGDGYGYERGESERIPIRWEEGTGTLTLGDRIGSYPGMPEKRIFRLKLPGSAPLKVVWDGKQISRTLRGQSR